MNRKYLKYCNVGKLKLFLCYISVENVVCVKNLITLVKLVIKKPFQNIFKIDNKYPT